MQVAQGRIMSIGRATVMPNRQDETHKISVPRDVKNVAAFWVVEYRPESRGVLVVSDRAGSSHVQVSRFDGRLAYSLYRLTRHPEFNLSSESLYSLLVIPIRPPILHHVTQKEDSVWSDLTNDAPTFSEVVVNNHSFEGSPHRE